MDDDGRPAKASDFSVGSVTGKEIYILDNRRSLVRCGLNTNLDPGSGNTSNARGEGEVFLALVGRPRAVTSGKSQLSHLGAAATVVLPLTPVPAWRPRALPRNEETEAAGSRALGLRSAHACVRYV